MRNPPLPARRHHYEFAHLALPAVVQHHRKKMLGTLVTTHADEFLHHLWQQVADNLPEAEQMEPQGLHCSLHTFQKHAIIIVALPEPICMTEAYFTSVVFGPFTNVKPEELEDLPFRYFTLEASCDSEGNDAGAIMCEWRDGIHSNFGGGPQATTAAFLEAIQSFIE